MENIADFLIENLNEIQTTLNDDHDGLFADVVSDLIRKVELYGSHFASLDIRQDSRVLEMFMLFAGKANRSFLCSRKTMTAFLKKIRSRTCRSKAPD